METQRKVYFVERMRMPSHPVRLAGIRDFSADSIFVFCYQSPHSALGGAQNLAQLV